METKALRHVAAFSARLAISLLRVFGWPQLMLEAYKLRLSLIHFCSCMMCPPQACAWMTMLSASTGPSKASAQRMPSSWSATARTWAHAASRAAHASPAARATFR